VRRLRSLAVAAVLAVATAAAYAPVLQSGFVNYDDDLYVTARPEVRAGLSREGLVWAFTSVQGANWFPLTRLSWLLDAELWGMDPAGFHATSLALHVLGTLGLLAALVRLTGALAPSAFAAAVFALHPLHVESVAWVAARKDVLAGVFFAATLLAYADLARRGPSLGRHALLVVCLGLGLMAKPILVTLPLVLLLLDVWPLRRLRDAGTLRRRVVEKLPLFLLAAAVAGVAVAAQAGGGAVQSLERYPPDVRAANAAVQTLAYLRQSVWPTGLSVFYPHPGGDLPAWRAAVAAAGLLALSAGALASLRRRPWVLVGWLWFVGMLLPVLGLVQLGQAARADRYTYLPLVGLALAVAFSVSDLVSRRRTLRWAAGAVAVGVAGALAVATHAQVRTWQGSRTLFEHALRVTEGNHVAHINLGAELLDAGELEDAEAHLRAALRIAPASAAAHGLLGRALARRAARSPDADRGRGVEAVRHLERALELEPEKAGLHAALGEALLVRGEWDRAAEHLATAVRLDPERAAAHAGLGVARTRQGRPEDAVRRFTRALALEPDRADVHVHLALVLARGGERERAIAHYGRALELDPGLASARAGLALLYLEAASPEAGLAHAREAIRLAPAEASYRALAGRLQTAAGREREAAARYREAVRLGDRSPDVLNNLAWTLATSADPGLRDPEEAVEMARRAAEATGGRSAAVLDTLAAAQAAAGRFDAAVVTADRALARARETGDAALAETIRTRRARYASGRGPAEAPAPSGAGSGR